MASISLHQVRTKTEYNLSELYDEYMGPDDKNCENEMSPFEYIDSNCDYYTPNQFRNMTKSLSPQGENLSAFCINCQSLTSNWDNFKRLLLSITSDTFDLDGQPRWLSGLMRIVRVHSL